jgi:hypothetical protein
MDEEGPETPRPAPKPVSQPHLEDPFQSKLSEKGVHNTLTLRSLRDERFKHKAKVLGLRQSLTPDRTGNTSPFSPKRVRAESVAERKKGLTPAKCAEGPNVRRIGGKYTSKRPISPAFPLCYSEEEEKSTSVSMVDMRNSTTIVRKKAIVKPDLRKTRVLAGNITVTEGNWHSVSISLKPKHSPDYGKRKSTSPCIGNQESKSKEAQVSAKTASFHLIRRHPISTSEWK